MKACKAGAVYRNKTTEKPSAVYDVGTEIHNYDELDGNDPETTF